MSNQDMLKIYISTYRSCLNHIGQQRRSIEGALYTKSFFLKCHIKNTYILEISDLYEKALRKNLTWYANQRGTRGVALPVAKRIRLPHWESGISGLGIQKE